MRVNWRLDASLSQTPREWHSPMALLSGRCWWWWWWWWHWRKRKTSVIMCLCQPPLGTGEGGGEGALRAALRQSCAGWRGWCRSLEWPPSCSSRRCPGIPRSTPSQGETRGWQTSTHRQVEWGGGGFLRPPKTSWKAPSDLPVNVLGCTTGDEPCSIHA